MMYNNSISDSINYTLGLIPQGGKSPGNDTLGSYGAPFDSPPPPGGGMPMSYLFNQPAAQQAMQFVVIPSLFSTTTLENLTTFIQETLGSVSGLFTKDVATTFRDLVSPISKRFASMVPSQPNIVQVYMFSQSKRSCWPRG